MQSTILNHTIPPFYSCYLLKSTIKVTTYIGSTPDPPRRIRQHNGLILGGAFRTKLARPWEMELIVFGFPTKLQALQFEWAWQNPHTSRHLHSIPTSSTSKPTAQFPKTALSNRPLTKVQVLQFMLTVSPWKQFNLSVQFFSEEAQSWWEVGRTLGPIVRTDAARRKWEKELKAKGVKLNEVDPWNEDGQVIDDVKTILRIEGVDGGRLVRDGTGEQEDRIKVDDSEFFHPQWEKWTSISHHSEHNCSICSKPISIVDDDSHLNFLICTSTSPKSPCISTFHLSCLASQFLSSSSSSTSPSIPDLLPTKGSCPTCSSNQHWQDLIRSMYRRWEEIRGVRKKSKKQRGGKEMKLLSSQLKAIKVKSVGKGKKKVSLSASDSLDSVSEEEEDLGSDLGEGEEGDEGQERSWAVYSAQEGALSDLDIELVKGGLEGEDEKLRLDWGEYTNTQLEVEEEKVIIVEEKVKIKRKKKVVEVDTKSDSKDTVKMKKGSPVKKDTKKKKIVVELTDSDEKKSEQEKKEIAKKSAVVKRKKKVPVVTYIELSD